MRRLKTGLMILAIVFITGLILAAMPQGVVAEAAGTGLSGAGKIMEDGIAVENYREAYAPQADEAAAGPVYSINYGGFEFQTTDSTLTFTAFGSGLYATSLPSSLSFKRGIDLPNGAQITRIDLYAIDNSSTNNITVQLYYFAPSVGINQTQITSLSTTGLPNSSSVQTVSLTGSPIVTIDNTANRYYFRYQPSIIGIDHVLVGMHVEYTLPVTYLPTVVIQ
jgi:hypothetical protein